MCANKEKTGGLTRMPTAGKAMKERNCTQMPVTKKKKRKKEKKRRTDHKCWWQTKNGCPNKASKQLTPNERKNKPQKLVANEKGLP